MLLVMFWNVENFFDTYDNPYRNDDEFTPKGENHWTTANFNSKRDDLAKTISLVAEQFGDYPALLGVCEVENAYVLNQLANHTPLSRAGYGFIHRESPDSRGIDVALLYRKDIFTPLEKRFFKADFPTREILYTKGVVNSLDTVHILVNHWPSKSGGEKSSEPKRMAVSGLVKGITDSLIAVNSKASIIIMGDLNDTPNSKSVKHLTGNGENLVNLTPFAAGEKGTYKYRGDWSAIDQFIVSANLMGPKAGSMPQWLYCRHEMYVFAPEFLLEWDEAYMGVKPRRTYQGPKYLGGVSDHLPIILKVYGHM